MEEETKNKKNHHKQFPIDKDELYQKYIVENLSRKECAKFFNVTERTLIRRLEEHGIKRDPKMTYINRQRAMIARYGVSHPSESQEMLDKAKHTMLERYGVEYTAQSKELQKKMQDTMMKRYGKKNFVETASFRIKSRNTCLKKHGVEYPCQFPQCIKALEDAVGHSKPEEEFANLLRQHGFTSFEREYPIRGFKYDFKLFNMLFEINPSGTHNANFGLFGHDPKPRTYHLTKSAVAKEHNLHCVHIFDWDDQDKIIRVFLNKKEKIYARNCYVNMNVSVKEARMFLEQNHLQGYARDSIRIGLYITHNDANDELVELMTFDKPRYNKKYEYELIRLCSNTKYNVIGGTEKIFAHFVKEYHPKSVISYCDLSKFDGTIYYKLGFTLLEKKPRPSKHWVQIETGQHITDNLLRQKGFDQLFKTDYGKGTSNEELMFEHGFVEIYDCGQLTYVKTFE